MDHQELASPPIRLIVGIGEPGIDGKVVVGIRIHQAGRDGIKALRGLPITLRNLRSQVARPPADGIGPQQREAAGLIDLPDLSSDLSLKIRTRIGDSFAMLRLSRSATIRSERAACGARSQQQCRRYRTRQAQWQPQPQRMRKASARQADYAKHPPTDRLPQASPRPTLVGFFSPARA